VSQVIARLQAAGIHYTVNTNDLQQWMDNETISDGSSRSRSRPSLSFETYNNFETISTYLEELAARCSICSVIDLGESYEGRPIRVVKLSHRRGRNKKAVFMDGGLHAREWISPATVLYLMDQIITRYSSPDQATRREVKQMLRKFDFFFLPVANPDGYAYTHDGDRMWRKTRSLNPGSSCIGADPNRNFDYHWGESGSSSDPCQETYRGSEPFSEVECSLMADFLRSRDIQFHIYLAVHSYGQYILAPWGYAAVRPDDYQQLYDAMESARDAMYDHSGNRYTIGSSAEALYAAAGASDDYAKGVAGIKYSYTVELQDSGYYGFILPASRIIDQGEEMYIGIQALVNWVKSNDF